MILLQYDVCDVGASQNSTSSFRERVAIIQNATLSFGLSFFTVALAVFSAVMLWQFFCCLVVLVPVPAGTAVVVTVLSHRLPTINPAQNPSCQKPGPLRNSKP